MVIMKLGLLAKNVILNVKNALGLLLIVLSVLILLIEKAHLVVAVLQAHI